MTDWLTVHTGNAPLVVTIPHAGTEIPSEVAGAFVSDWDARRDADWWIDRLYHFAPAMGATVIRTAISRSVIDVNRDPSGMSLYPGMATTGLCPTENFDGAPLYRGPEPGADEIARRRELYFDPYHRAVADALTRLRASLDRVVLYDAHSIRSRIPRLFEGELPQFSIGTNDGASCDPALTDRVTGVLDGCATELVSRVVDGRFKGGWTTRHYGSPGKGVHAIQMELAMRGYLRESAEPTPDDWPPAYDPEFAAPMAAALRRVLGACIEFAQGADT